MADPTARPRGAASSPASGGRCGVDRARPLVVSPRAVAAGAWAILPRVFPAPGGAQTGQAASGSGKARVPPRMPALVFDLDGTLVDTVYAHVFAWQRAFSERG